MSLVFGAFLVWLAAGYLDTDPGQALALGVIGGFALGSGTLRLIVQLYRGRGSGEPWF